MDFHPDRPPTRHLERLEVDRFRPLKATIREIGDGFVVLDVSGASDASATRVAAGVALAGEPITAGSLTVRIDAVGPRTFRYRFAPGDHVPAGVTPMLAADVRVHEAARSQRTAAGVSITSDEASIEVEVPTAGGPTLRVRRADGHLVGTIGGGESNLMGAWDAFPTGICRTPVPGHRLATEVFSLRDDECVYGFGEQFGRLDKVGRTIDVNMEEAMGTVAPRAYKNVPFWVTTAGWGVFANHDARLTAWIGSRSAPQLQVAVDDDWLDAFVFVGDVRQVLDAYTALTGRPNVPPDWSFGAEVTHARTGEWIIWARAAFAGSQRYPLHWGGDSSARWDNLFANVGGGLSLGLCGFPFWSMDIGGFMGEPDDPLLIRWLQAGLFLSHSRIHGFGKRELYGRGATTDLARDLLHLRYRLLPYLLGQAHRSAVAGVPLARPLVVDHPDDPTTWHLSDQWLLGDDVLVAPVATPDGDRRVYLPEGEWVHWFTGERHRGPIWLATHSPIEHFPLYQRAASLVPLGPVMPHVGARPTDLLTLRAGAPAAPSDWHGVARVDGSAVTLATTRRDPAIVVGGLPPGVDVRVVDGAGAAVDRPIRRT